LERKEKQTGIPMWDAKEVASIKNKIRDEYIPKKPKRDRKGRIKVDKVVKQEDIEGGTAAGDTKETKKFEVHYNQDGKEVEI